MKILKHALLLSGLFFSFCSFAQTPNYDPTDFKYPDDRESWCSVEYPEVCASSAPSALDAAIEKFLTVQSTQSATTKLTAVLKTKSYPSVTAVVFTYEVQRQEWRLWGNPATYQWVTLSPNNGSSQLNVKKQSSTKQCPPFDHQDYTIGPITTDGEQRCYKPLLPLDCSALKGVGSSSLYDRFVVGSSAGYTYQNPPSCLTKCAQDENGSTRCADCKVVAPSWSRSVSGDGQTESWWANAGTFTGAACGQNESEIPPPEAPKCWETTNGLSMCIQDPAEKCVTVSGVQQCESGCGYVNEAFYCAEKEQEKPNPNDKDKPIPDPDDNISNPDKPLADMIKGDFKDVQRGVESRIVGVGVAVSNVENSVDALGNTLDSMNKKLDTANGIGESQLGYLKGIKDGITELNGGDGDGEGGEPDGNCDPLKDKKCDGNTGASGIKSWWNTKYPDGLGGLITEKQDAFYQSEAYKAITFDLTTGGGTLPIWNFCMNMGFADYGCKDLSLPSWLWGFIKACMMFGAAILARRLLIGA